MKKIIIFFSAILIVAAVLPIIGNSVMQTTIDTRLKELQTYGLETQNIESEQSYLTTKKHFEFLLKDADKFIDYLNKYADGQIPPYVNATLEGVTVGADLEYSNLPFSREMTLDIYPMSISEEMAKNLKSEDEKFYNYVEKFLKNKGVLYHINYEIISEDFDGFLKDIDEVYTLEDKTKLKLHLLDATFEGNGELIAPNRITSSLKKLQLDIKTENEEVVFLLEDLSSANSYESKSTYLSSGELKDFHFNMSTLQSDLELSLKEIKFNASSNTQSEFAQINSKSSFEALKLTSKELNLDMKKFNIDMAVNALDKVSFEESLELLSQMRDISDPLLEQKLQKSLTTLLSKGFIFTLADFSVEDILLNNSEELHGFKVQNQTTLRADKDFAQKMQMSPLLLASNLEMMTKIRVSIEMYEKLSKLQAGLIGFEEYLKVDGNDYLIDILLKDGGLSINGKALR